MIEEGRQLTRRCGPLSAATTARIQALGLALLIHTVCGVGFCLRVGAVKG